jgi:hypothetical protein
MKNALPGSTADAPRLTDKVTIGALTRIVRRDIVDAVLAETGRVEKRSRLLPAHVVVYFVMAMAIFRDGYEELLRKLVGGLQFMGNWNRRWHVPTTGAVSQARHQLGEQPLRELFTRVAVPLARSSTAGAWLRSWRLMAIDGVQIDVPDTPENLAAFGKYRDGTRRPFPQIRSVGLGFVNAQVATQAHRWIVHHPDDRPLEDIVVGPRTAWGDELVSVEEDGRTRRELWIHRRLPVSGESGGVARRRTPRG